MKEYIIVCVLLPFLLFFPIQFVINQVNHYKIIKINDIIYSAAHNARLEGYFTEEIVDKMKNELINNIPDLTESEIELDLTRIPKYRTETFNEQELICYKVCIPIERLTAYRSFTEEKENSMKYTIKGKVHSEVLQP